MFQIVAMWLHTILSTWSLKFARIVFSPQKQTVTSKQTSMAALCAMKFRQSTGSVLKSTGEWNCMTSPNSLLRMSAPKTTLDQLDAFLCFWAKKHTYKNGYYVWNYNNVCGNRLKLFELFVLVSTQVSKQGSSWWRPCPQGKLVMGALLQQTKVILDSFHKKCISRTLKVYSPWMIYICGGQRNSASQFICDALKA